ncbi:histidine kinase [Salegentibacter sp. JZCK2]|uniref:sensor histidine kinase n=1 Tax=Salegentibacter tibetensis TaxID=2873600 RepID=UPI001CCEBDAE|nr:histidine kinase [Salegentibacter tibetensis]MBZ9731443.1 histidine kinase [Salegentibacter tibetensis]
MIFSLYPVVVLGAFIKIGRIWFEHEKYVKQLKNDQLESEIKYLRAQVHPHFLFNTLNNLYALTLKNSKKAGEVVLKLSEMLDYFLYEGNQWKVSLEKELELLGNYISLEKIRYGDRLEVTFQTEGTIEGQNIPPLLLLPFVENSFKHGASQLQSFVWIKIRTKVENNVLHFHVSNKRKKINKMENKKKGLGLNNVEKRLDLLYKGHYSLKINDQEDFFQIDLVVALNQVKIIDI